MLKGVIAGAVAMTLVACASSKQSGEGYPYAQPADFVEYKFEHKSDVVHVPSDYETALWTPSQDKKLSGDWVVTEWRKVTIMEPRIIRGEGGTDSTVTDSSGVTTIEVPIRKMEKVVYFDFDSHALKTSAKATLKALPLSEADGYFIDAHADSIGTDPYNEKLSERRAKAVLDYLVEVGGIEQARLTYKGYGFTRPVAPNDTEENMQKNRRTEIYIRGSHQQGDTSTAAPMVVP